MQAQNYPSEISTFQNSFVYMTKMTALLKNIILSVFTPLKISWTIETIFSMNCFVLPQVYSFLTSLIFLYI